MDGTWTTIQDWTFAAAINAVGQVRDLRAVGHEDEGAPGPPSDAVEEGRSSGTGCVEAIGITPALWKDECKDCAS